MKKLYVILFALLLITGCRSGGSGGTEVKETVNPGTGTSSPSGETAGLTGEETGGDTSRIMLTSIQEDITNPIPEGVTNPVPEPATIVLFSMGLGGLALSKLRKRNKKT